MMWHILDAGSVWVRELAAALSPLVPTTAWAPVMRPAGMWESWEREESLAEPALTLVRYPLQRGYHRAPLSSFVQLGPNLVRRLLARTPAQPAQCPLIVTTPYYAPVAEQWPGPVVYYQTDKTVAYAGVNPEQVRALDSRLCRVAQAVCPNSRRVAEYMTAEAGCDPHKITVVPNATRAANVLPAPPDGPGPLPPDLQDFPRPIAGVLGNLAANMDWTLLEASIDATPGLSWAFVGPTSMPVYDRAQRAARARVMTRGSRVRFVGEKSYFELQRYARALDVAVLPYRRQEPTYSGSSTRFYEHLAACRPMLATRGFEELLHQEPLLKLVDTPAEVAAAANRLAANGFRDGYEQARWQASQHGTWEERARMLVAATLAAMPEMSRRALPVGGAA